MIFAASVRLHARKHFFQSFQKAFNFVGWSLFQFFQIQLHYYKLMSAYAPKVWSPHGANFKYPHKKTIWLWHEYRKMNRILKKATSPKNKEAYSFYRISLIYIWVNLRAINFNLPSRTTIATADINFYYSAFARVVIKGYSIRS